jgi:hypothetical protein
MVMPSGVLEPEHRARWGPACGLGFVVFLAVSFLVNNTPNTNKSPQYIYAWYNKSSHQTSLKISLILADIAVVFAVFFYTYLRDRFGRTDVGARFAPMVLAGAVVLVTGGLIFSGADLALFDQPKHMTLDTAQTLNFIQSDIGALATVVGVSILMFASWIIIWKTRILPVWLGWVALVLAVVGLAGPLGFIAFLASGIWFLIVAFLMWRFEERLPVPGTIAGGPSRDATGATLDQSGDTLPPT